jgi:hypothetical protein
MSLPSTRNVAGMGKSSAPYLRFEALHRIGLSGTEFARAQVGIIRLRLLKTVVTRNTRRIRLWLSSSFPL